MYVCMYVYMYVYIHMHTHTHRHTHMIDPLLFVITSGGVGPTCDDVTIRAVGIHTLPLCSHLTHNLSCASLIRYAGLALITPGGGVDPICDDITIYALVMYTLCVCSHPSINVHTHTRSGTTWSLRPGVLARITRGWPLQGIVLLRGCCARIDLPFIAPSHLHCPHGCNTIAIPLRNIRPPSEPLFVCHTPYHIVHSNIV